MQPLTPHTSSLLSHHPLCPSVCFLFARGNCQPEIPSAVVWGQVTRGQTALEDDWSATTIRTSRPWNCPWQEGDTLGGIKRWQEQRQERKGEVCMRRGVLIWRSIRRKVGRAVLYRAWGKKDGERIGELPCLLFSWSYKQNPNPCDLLSISLSTRASLLNNKTNQPK